MATQYIINFADNSDKVPFVVQPGERNQSTSLDVYGMGAIAYGEGLSENLIRMLENFSHSKAPRNPTKGQLWFDSQTDTLKYQDGSSHPLVSAVKAAEMSGVTPSVWAAEQGGIYTGLMFWSMIYQAAYEQGWVAVAGTVAGDTEPEDKNTLWFDSSDLQLKVWNGTAYVSVADQYLKLDGTGIVTGNVTVANDVALTNGIGISRNYIKVLDPNNVGSPNDLTIAAVHDVRVVIDGNNNDTNSEFVVSHDGYNDTDINQDDLFSVNENGVVTIFAGNLDMKTHRIVNLAAPLADNDAVRRIDLDTSASTKVSSAGATMTGALTVTGITGSGAGGAPGEGSFGIKIDNRTSTDAGGILLFCGDNNNDENAIEVVNTLGVGGIVQKVMGVKSTSGDTYIKGKVDVGGNVTIDLPSSSITQPRHAATKEYVDDIVAGVGIPTGVKYPFINYSGAPQDGNIKIDYVGTTAYISMYANGWKQIFPAVM